MLCVPPQVRRLFTDSLALAHNVNELIFKPFFGAGGEDDFVSKLCFYLLPSLPLRWKEIHQFRIHLRSRLIPQIKSSNKLFYVLLNFFQAILDSRGFPRKSARVWIALNFHNSASFHFKKMRKRSSQFKNSGLKELERRNLHVYSQRRVKQATDKLHCCFNFRRNTSHNAAGSWIEEL